MYFVLFYKYDLNFFLKKMMYYRNKINDLKWDVLVNIYWGELKMLFNSLWYFVFLFYKFNIWVLEDGIKFGFIIGIISIFFVLSRWCMIFYNS